ncbi:MAG: response regulator [Anaerolineae bacterium]|nr:response regulator [Anaerolineae bacterium]
MIWLIAEDETDILNLVATMSQVWGHKPLTFTSGQKVWDWLDKVEAGEYRDPLPDFVLMDIRMPGKKGNEVARRMRRMSHFQHIPIALMTAFSLNAEERSVMTNQDGVDQIISKPLPDFHQLHALLDSIIAKKYSRT